MINRLPGRPLLVLAPLLAVAAAAVSQEPPVTFKREGEVVTVDVVVVDRKGEPITGLTRDDFTVLDEGVAQSILNFEVIHVDETPPAPADRPPARARVR